jgi:hypothetical protein
MCYLLGSTPHRPVPHPSPYSNLNRTPSDKHKYDLLTLRLFFYQCCRSGLESYFNQSRILVNWNLFLISQFRNLVSNLS